MASHAIKIAILGDKGPSQLGITTELSFAFYNASAKLNPKSVASNQSDPSKFGTRTIQYTSNAAKKKSSKNQADIALQLADAAGDDHLITDSVKNANLVILAFSVADRNSYKSVLDKWKDRARALDHSVPLFVVGLRTELRNDPETLRRLQAEGHSPISFSLGMRLAERLECPYEECSAKDLSRVSELFSIIINLAVQPTKENIEMLRMKERGEEARLLEEIKKATDAKPKKSLFSPKKDKKEKHEKKDKEEVEKSEKGSKKEISEAPPPNRPDRSPSKETRPALAPNPADRPRESAAQSVASVVAPVSKPAAPPPTKQTQPTSPTKENQIYGESVGGSPKSSPVRANAADASPPSPSKGYGEAPPKSPKSSPTPPSPPSVPMMKSKSLDTTLLLKDKTKLTASEENRVAQLEFELHLKDQQLQLARSKQKELEAKLQSVSEAAPAAPAQAKPNKAQNKAKRLSVARVRKLINDKHKRDNEPEEQAEDMSTYSVLEWTEQDVAKWLVELNLADLVEGFAKHGITGPSLLELSEKDLKQDMNIKLGPCKILLKEIALLKERAEAKKELAASIIQEHFRKYSTRKQEEKKYQTRAREDSFEIRWEDIKIDRKIGEGASGVVYKGVWNEFGVAVKRLKSQTLETTLMKEFLLEVSIMKRLAAEPHPNIVSLVGICTTPPNLCIVTKFYPLGCIIGHLGELAKNYTDVARLSLDICRGMSYLHAKGIIHRDLALRNCLVSDENNIRQIKITDFGMSRFSIQSVNQTTTNHFALKWAAPESLRSFVYSKESDVWAWGICCMELINRGDPYPGVPDQDVAVAVMNGLKHPDVPESCPAHFKGILLECWKTDPTKRPTFAKLVTQLERIVPPRV